MSGQSVMSDFRQRLGIDAAGPIPTEIDKVEDNDLLLTMEQRNRLLRHIVPEQYIDDTDYSAYLCAIRHVSDSIFLVEYGLMGFDMEAVFMATYSKDGTLKDSMYCGNSWFWGEGETIDEEKGTQLIYATEKNCCFRRDDSFSITTFCRQIQMDYEPDSTDEKYRYQDITSYRISSEGLFVVESSDISETGEFQGWNDSMDRYYNAIALHCIDMLPQSDPQRFNAYMDFANKNIANEDDSVFYFSGSFYEYGYSVNPVSALQWLYGHKSSDTVWLLSVLQTKYETDLSARLSIERNIDFLDPDAREYFIKQVHDWQKESND